MGAQKSPQWWPWSELYDDAGYILLMTEIRSLAEEHMSTMTNHQYSKEQVAEFTLHMWAIVYESGSSHATHTHPGSITSGTCYLDVSEPNSAAPLLLLDPRGGQVDDAELIHPNVPFSQDVVFKPNALACILFPSWQPHRVPAVQHSPEQRRVGFAFNVGPAVDSGSWSFSAQP
jgi:uncharacterized protein (TIGR02466 family)